jgi:N-acetyl sugar amidotransferase
MHPLTVTWSPLKYTDIGWQNLNNFNDSGFDIILGMPQGDVKRKLTRVAMIEMGDPFQAFIYGQVLFPLTIALKFGIKLIFRGENAEAEYGGSPESWNKKFLPMEEFKKVWISNYVLDFWLDKGFTKKELSFFYPPMNKEFENKVCDSYFYGYFRNWSNHSNFYYASKNTGFKPNQRRTEGTYTKYSSIDDKLDTFHHWFALLKFGHGRCTSNAAREIREGYITREEGVALVHKYDTEFPKLYFKEFLEFTNLKEDEFWDIAERWRNQNIWTKKGNEWVKKYPVK